MLIPKPLAEELTIPALPAALRKFPISSHVGSTGDGVQLVSQVLHPNHQCTSSFPSVFAIEGWSDFHIKINNNLGKNTYTHLLEDITPSCKSLHAEKW